ncbi:hypothetical protein ACSTLA_23410, partial [Vibrio parahaemolyticus]
TAAVLDELSRRLDAPLLISAVTERGPNLYNSSLLWTADGAPQQMYDKRH